MRVIRNTQEDKLSNAEEKRGSYLAEIKRYSAV